MSASGFYCQECSHPFRTVKAAERASFGEDGCPSCGSSDIDLGDPKAARPFRASAEQRGRAATPEHGSMMSLEGSEVK